MKTGRNDPCPCGSGKKYKHCCLAASVDAAGAPAELAWRRIRRANEGLVGKMLHFVEDTYGEFAFDDAWDEFTLGIVEEDPATSQHRSVFLPWMLHQWAPDPLETSVPDESLHGVQPTRAYLEKKGKSLDPVTRRYLEACLVAPFSFHEIVDCDAGVGFRTRDLITGDVHDVLERSGSQTLQKGDVLFASLVQCDGIVMMEGVAPAIISPIHKLPILELRKQITANRDLLSAELLLEWDIELRALYLDIMDLVLNPPMPQLRNTDGDEIVPQRLIFDIDSPQEVFDALKHLSLEADEGDLLAGAEHDAEGRLLRMSFQWLKPGNRVHKDWNNTSLGTIEINRGRLTVDVNSQKRATKFKRIVKKALQERARYRVTEIESLEPALADAAAPGRTSGAHAADDDDLAANPEIRAQLTEMMSMHYDRWLKEKIPALRGKTPLQAVKDPDTREMVEALVSQIERDGLRMTPPLDASIPRRLRERLGLNPR